MSCWGGALRAPPQLFTPIEVSPPLNYNFPMSYEGKAKIMKDGPTEGTMIMYFKDDVTAGNGKKKDSIPGKGKINKAITLKLLQLLEDNGIETHLIEDIDERSILVKKLKIFPLEVVVRNKATGSIVRRLGFEKGTEFKRPLFELFYKNDELHDPLICQEHAFAMNLIYPDDLLLVRKTALDANEILKEYFSGIGFDLIDIKFEFGVDDKENIYLADEISPDTMRLWEKGTQVSFDKDVFREDKADLLETYKEVAKRMGLKVEGI